LKGHHKEGCPHVNVNDVRKCSSDKYWKNLTYVLLAPTDAEYRRCCLATGISKPTIFLGFNESHVLGISKCFGSAMMHLLALNIPDFIIPLWHGTFSCDVDDDHDTWTWAVLIGDTWKQHGRMVASSTIHIPGCFGRPPRNIQEKINSGYKAWEFMLYLYRLAPGLLYGILPLEYWQHFCLLVRAVRIFSQYSITQKDLVIATRSALEFIGGFEQLYYQHHIDCMHFVWQSIHALSHYGNEVETKGPLICASQWTMERTIGNLVEEIRQPSNPYANLGRRAIRRAQINALKAIIPSLDPDTSKPSIPRWSKDIGSGYVLLKSHERSRHAAMALESRTICDYLQHHYPQSPEFNYFDATGIFRLCRWAHLRLPNLQSNRSMFATREQCPNARRARNVKVHEKSFL
jgi:hypothetical protein